VAFIPLTTRQIDLGGHIQDKVISLRWLNTSNGKIFVGVQGYLEMVPLLSSGIFYPDGFNSRELLVLLLGRLALGM